jgi:signal peptidase
MQSPPAIEKNQIDRGERCLRVLSLLLTVFFGILTVLNIVLIVKSWIYPDVPPTVFGYNASVVNTDVMESDRVDAIFSGDLAFLKKTSYENVKIGDIAVYLHKDTVIVGRIAEANSNGTYRITCDSAEYRHMVFPTLTEDNHFGKIVGRIPHLGAFARFMLSIPGMILFIFIPFLICLYIFILEVRDYRRECREEQEAAALANEAADPVNEEPMSEDSLNEEVSEGDVVPVAACVPSDADEAEGDALSESVDEADTEGDPEATDDTEPAPVIEDADITPVEDEAIEKEPAEA